MSTSRRAWVCARECTRVSVGAWEPRGPPPSPSLPWECRRRRGNAEGRPCALRRRQGRAWGAGVCPLPTPRSAQGGRRVHPQTHQPAAAVTPGRPSCLRGGDTVSPLTAGSGQGWAVRPFPGTLGQAASEAPGAGPGPCFLLLIPCGRRSGTVRQGLGGQLGPLPVSLSRGLLLVFILLAVPTCLAHRLSDSVFTAEETLQVPASASPRDPAGCVVQAGPSVSAWLTRPLRARPVLGHLFRSSSWPHRLSGLRTGLLCGGLASPPPLSRWGVQGPGGKVAGPGSLLGDGLWPRLARNRAGLMGSSVSPTAIVLFSSDPPTLWEGCLGPGLCLASCLSPRATIKVIRFC